MRAFFLGTDSAPHPVSHKLNVIGIPGLFNSPVAIESYSQVFEEDGKLDRLEAFASLNGPRHYGLPPNDATVTLEAASWTAPEEVAVEGPDERALIHRGGEQLRAGASSRRDGGRREGGDMTASFIDRKTMAEPTAKMLLEVQAVHFNAEKPYIFTSGWASPVYIDCRKLISYPRVRRSLMDFADATLARDVGFEQFDAVAGGETAGIPFAAWIADRLGAADAVRAQEAEGLRPQRADRRRRCTKARACCWSRT